MFTEGLDETEINWVKQGSEVEEARVVGSRSPLSPLTEKPSPHESFPKSPLSPIPKSSILCNSNTFSSSHLLPPLKFHSGLLTPHRLVAPARDDDDDESVASVSGGNYSDEEMEIRLGLDEEEGHMGPNYVDYLKRPAMHCYNEEYEMFENRLKTKLNKGSLKDDLKIKVPGNFRRFTTDGELGRPRLSSQNSSTPSGICSAREQFQLHNPNSVLEGVYGSQKNMLKEVGDLGTPSAPPFIDIGGEGRNFLVETDFEPTGERVCKSRDSECSDGIREASIDRTSQSMQSTEFVRRQMESVTKEEEEKISYWQTCSADDSAYYNTSGQYAWQTLIAYDACIRLCLHAWARGCTEAPEFLRDECLALRSAFGLHKFLLQPQRVRPMEIRTTENAEKVLPSEVKKVVGKIRVEVKKVRVIPRRKLKCTYSQRSAIYLQMSKEYVRQISSVVKTSINSIKDSSFSVTSEEKLSCSFQLKSTSEDTQVEQGSTIWLRPGSGDYHIL